MLLDENANVICSKFDPKAYHIISQEVIGRILFSPGDPYSQGQLRLWSHLHCCLAQNCCRSSHALARSQRVGLTRRLFSSVLAFPCHGLCAERRLPVFTAQRDAHRVENETLRICILDIQFGWIPSW